jgi:hypothetical protein
MITNPKGQRKMKKNEFGEILESVWNGLPSHYPNIILHEHVVMPDHFHAIIQIDNEHIGGNASVGGWFQTVPYGYATIRIGHATRKTWSY